MISNEWRKKKILSLLPAHKTAISVAMGLSKGVLFRLMEEMQYADDSLHIGHWTKLPNNCWVAVYVAGDGDDAPRPSLPVKAKGFLLRGRRHEPVPSRAVPRDTLDVALFGLTGVGHQYTEGEPYAFAV